MTRNFIFKGGLSFFIATSFFFGINRVEAKNLHTSFNLPKASLTESTVMSPVSFFAGGGGTLTRTANFTAFTACQGSNSLTQTFTVAATGLTSSANVLITAPTGFEISITAGGLGSYSTNITLSQTAGVVTSTTVYIRLSSSAAAGTYSGSIAITSAGASADLSIALPSSTVNALPTASIGTILNSLTNASSFDIPLSATSGTPDQFSIIAGSPALTSFTAISAGTLSGTSINVPLPSTKNEGTYNFSLRVKKSSTGCESSAVPVSLTVAKIVTTGTISAFTTCVGTASDSKSFTVTSAGLTNNLTITAPSYYEVSRIGSNSGFQDTVVLTQSNGSIAATTIYVRIKGSMATSALTIGGRNVTLVSSGANQVNIAIPTSTINAIPTLTVTGNKFYTVVGINLS